MKRIAFFQDNLKVGGIQKSLLNLLNNLDYDKYDVDVYLTDDEKYWDAEFPPQLNVIRLIKPPRYLSFLPFKLAKRLYSFDFSQTAKYDLAVDFNSYQFSCALGAISVPASRRAMWVHNDVEKKLNEEWRYRVLWSCFKGKFQYYDWFVGVSEALLEPFRRMSGAANKQYCAIPNFIDVKEIREKSKELASEPIPDEGEFNFVALGRLCHQKGYDIMFDAFKEACGKRDDLRLYIIGDGADRNALERYRDELGLSNKIFFLGAKSNPFSLMSKMDAFISTSRYEGQGMNIMEAMVLGLPLYCSANLESYIKGLRGYENMAEAIASAKKEKKRPNDLSEYNGEILAAIERLADGEKV